jgi:hypothetical protein
MEDVAAVAIVQRAGDQGSLEGSPGPVAMGEVFLVPGFGESAIYHSSGDYWQIVALENSGSTSELVWTGREVLMWGSACCNDDAGRFRFQDAWRWTPPPD